MDKPTVKSWIWRVSRPDAGIILLLAVLNAVTSGCSVAFALISRQVVDIATGDAAGSLLWSGIGLIAVLLAQVGLEILLNRLNVWASGRIEIRIKQSVFSTLFNKQWQALSAYHSGDLMNRLTNDCNVIVTGIVSLTPRVTGLATRLIACLVVLFMMDWRFTLVMLALGGVMLLASRAYGRRMKKLHKLCQETDGSARSFMQESLENWMVIQSFSGDGFVRDKLADRLNDNFRAKLRRNRWSSLSGAAIHLLFSGSYYAALAWGAVRLAAHAITYGTLTAFLQIISQIRAPFINMSGLLPQYYNMLASAERMLELNDLPDEPRSALPEGDATALYARLRSLRVSGVDFAYDEKHPVLENAALEIRKGEFLALVGFSGIGKSTLFKLLLAFCTPQAGTLTAVLEDGERTLDAATRGLFAYVPQQNLLLSGTIRENIAFCHPDATDAEIMAAAETADAADMIRALPSGLDTVLGERGTGLSEGQVQRLAIARAVLGGAPILLLDEVTSSLDEQTEERVLRRLRALPGRTCLCISHRPAALALCDRVIRVADRQFAEETAE